MNRAQSFDHLAERYDRLGELTADHVTAWLPTVLPANRRRAIDLGCGAGRHAVVLADHFDQVDAIDLSGPMIRLARRKRPRANISYVEAGILDITGQYDFVTSSATLHHVADLPAVLRHIRSLLAPGGIAALADTVSARPATPRWWLYGGQLRILTRNLASRNPHAWEIFRLATGDWLEHRASDRYLSRETFEQTYAAALPGARFTRVGNQHAALFEK
ncbi:2-polyprenyl-3-methyl-5-hydroxy-6-metoxy-1,4-benzoquinol methylase [Kribbella aluminosa]|uniref:2-polyprenyl-3-methyl-5-hydroxy-6-metoxy-1, 4-benzoquinol methylase n=1 Tax=Kribbella aluminosa TaxID=416017 RepID=A0ABS4UVS6_9ACTN|nr:class I SAM-dependent methyltransferase [Kribbella aluminosa]MBP2355745.1 2-polyprenyl-3-methyl-5-hydroxy-6-metoxy-1,4-benzoquinol methylase [Kribbella aluminosa]